MKQLFLLLIFVFLGCATPRASEQSADMMLCNSLKNSPGPLDKYVGTWKYVNGKTSLTIVFREKEYPFSLDVKPTFYTRVLIGEYMYIENGIEKVNTLADLEKTIEVNNLFGTVMVGPATDYKDVFLNAKMVVYFTEPVRIIPGFKPEMILESVNKGGVKKLKVIFDAPSAAKLDNDDAQKYSNYSIPFGKYILTKVN